MVGQIQRIVNTLPSFQYFVSLLFSNPVTDESYAEPDEKDRILTASIFWKCIQFYNIFGSSH